MSDLFYGLFHTYTLSTATYNLIFNASLLVEEGLGNAVGLNGIINTTGKSTLCFRPLAPKLENEMSIVWKKSQLFFKPATKLYKANVVLIIYIGNFTQLTQLFVNSVPGSSFFLKGLLLQIMSDLLDKTFYDNIPINIGMENEARLFDKISGLIAAENGRITRSELSAHLQYDDSYLNKIVKKYSDLNLFGYSSVICMKETKRLLWETALSIAKVAGKLKFTNHTHFYKFFEKHFSMTPKQYRRSLGKK